SDAAPGGRCSSHGAQAAELPSDLAWRRFPRRRLRTPRDGRRRCPLPAARVRVIAAHASIPAGVPYAAAPSQDWVNVPVLGELAFHGLQSLGGDRALVLAQVIAVAVSFLLLARGMQVVGAPDASRAIVLTAVFF